MSTTVGTNITNSSYTSSTTINKLTNTDTNSNEILDTNSLLYYIDNPKTQINYNNDNYFAVYLCSKIFHNEYYWNTVTFLQNLFNITSVQAGLMINSDYGESEYNYYFSNDQTIPNDLKPLDTLVFINNINFSSFIKYINDNDNTISISVIGNSPNIKLQIKKTTNNSGNVARIIKFEILLKRSYKFLSSNVDLNKYISLKNNTYSISFQVDKKDNQRGIQQGLSIKCSDVKNYIWFSVESYKQLYRIDFTFNNDSTGNIGTGTILNSYNTDYGYKGEINSNTYYLINTVSSNIQEEYNGSISGYTNINSDFFSEWNTKLSYNKYRSIIKLYLSPSYIQHILGDTNNDINSINIKLIFDEDNIIDIIDESVTAISDANVFRLSANSHCCVDYIKQQKIYRVWGGPNKTEQDFLIGIYKLNKNESDFNGNISVFYGNKLIKPELNSTNSTLYYYVRRNQNYLYIYLKTRTEILLNNFINVYLSDDVVENNEKDEIEYTNVKSTILQNDVVLHTIDINIPQVSAGDTNVLIDDSVNNKTKHYTNYTVIPTQYGYTYYGVRAIGYYDDSDEIQYFNSYIKNIGIDGLTYNVNCNVVKLDPINEQNVIYSFINGEQLLVLNQKNTDIKFKNFDNYKQIDTVNNNELLGSDLLSYEYIVEGKKGDGDYNLNFSLSYINRELTPTTYSYNSNKNYYIGFSYIQTTDLSESEKRYEKITNISPNYPITFNIDENIDNNLYNYSFEEYINEDDIVDKDNIYEEIIEYVKIPSNSITFNIFKDIVINFNSKNEEEYEYSKYYKYSSITNKYTPYTYSDIKNLSSVPLNIYVKYKYYLKTAEEIDTVKRNLKLSNYKRFRKVYEYKSIGNINFNDINSYISSDRKYYQKIGEQYIPINGFIRDGSSNYYGYKLKKSSDCLGVDNDVNYNISYQQKSNIYITVKQKYSVIGSKGSGLTIDELLNNYVLRKIDLYTSTDKYDDILYYKEIDTSTNPSIYDLDLSGNTIYSSSNNRTGILDIDTIKKQYYGLFNEENNEEITQEYIERNYENSPYKIGTDDENSFRINVGTEEAPDKKGIKYIVSLNGNFSKIDTTQINSVLDSGKFIFIKEPGFNPLRPIQSLEYDDTNLNIIEKLKKYNNSDNYLYIPILSKLNADDLKENNNLIKGPNNNFSDPYKYFYNIDNIYYRIDPSTGFILDNCYINTSTDDINLPTQVELFYLNEEYTRSYDIHMSINKNYFELIDKDKSIGYDILSYNSSYIKWYSDNISYSYIKNIDYNDNKVVDLNTITFYTYAINNYSYGPYYKTIQGLAEANNIIYGSDYEKSSYTDEIIFKSKYLYDNFTINDGIHTEKNGSYFTNILTFDGKNGKISRKLYLNRHIQNITKYSYDIQEVSYLTATKEDLLNLSIYEYDKYYVREKISNNSEEDTYTYIQLNSTSESPLSQLLANKEIYTKISETKTYKYNCLDNQLSYTINNSIKYPSIIKLNDVFYGLVFNNNISDEISSDTIGFKNIHDYITNNSTEVNEPEEENSNGENDTNAGYVKNSNILFDTTTEIKYFNEGDNSNSNNNTEVKNALLAANNELYYNNYSDDDTKSLYIIKTKFTPQKFIYELTELSQFTFRQYNSDTSIIQPKKIETKEIKSEKPFSIKNGEELKFTGTYSWVNPTYKTVILDDGSKHTIIEKEGYYQKDYVIADKPLTVNTYNFYPKDEISSVNIAYNYNPSSYIISAEISHPSISYNYMVNEIVERIKYTYLLNGFEYDYPNTGNIVYENGSYYGNINIPIYPNGSTMMKIKLYRKNDIVTTTSIKEIEHQKKYTSYEYFAYQTATSLTNEKIPVLYNTELIPAKSHVIQFWDTNKNSYALKNVIDSYAYYSYKYKYETVPFKVASYIFTDDLRISNFDTLGSYIKSIGDYIGEKVGVQAYAVNGLTTDLSEIFNHQIEQEKTIAQNSDLIFSTYINNLNESISSLNDKSYISASNLSEILTNKFEQSIKSNEEVINNLNETLGTKIVEHHNIIKESFNSNNEILDAKLNDIKTTLHSDLIGDNSEEKEIELVTYTTTYTPVYEDKKIVPPIGPLAIVSAIQAVSPPKIIGYTYETIEDKQTITVNTSSIAQILSSSLSSTSTSTQRIDNEDGSYIITTGQTTSGLGDILKDLKIGRKLPNYAEFMCDLVPKLFSSIDFEADYDIKYDVHGNVLSKTKRNPSDMAKKCISNADALWKEMKKKGIVS